MTRNSSIASRPLRDRKFNDVDSDLIIENILRPGIYHFCLEDILVRFSFFINGSFSNSSTENIISK